ncbi:MAG TPA: hypothetical protein VHV77_04640, partial [Pirellulales bacterium]|nr:hypothetical protein [Pirellulales bacterium]
MHGSLRAYAVACGVLLITGPAASQDSFPPNGPQTSLSSLVQRRPVPDATAIAKAEASVKQKLKNDLASATTAEAKLTLVAKLLGETATDTGDPAERYATLCEARHLAIDAGDVMLMRQTVAALADRFAVDARDALITALAKMAEKSSLATVAYKEIAATAAGEAATSVLQHEWDRAKQLSDISLVAARKSKNAMVTKQMVEFAKTVSASRQQWEAAEQALEVLKTYPNDAAAHLVAGRYLCFVQQDWSEGLKHLAASSDATLKMLAVKSLATPDDPAAQERLGDAWW